VRPVIDIDVTIIPLIITPNMIPEIVRVFGIDKRYAASAPVQTPVNGKGIPINKIKPTVLYLLILFDEVCVLFRI